MPPGAKPAIGNKPDLTNYLQTGGTFAPGFNGAAQIDTKAFFPGAAIVAIDPLLMYYGIQPMSDVPAAAPEADATPVAEAAAPRTALPGCLREVWWPGEE